MKNILLILLISFGSTFHTTLAQNWNWTPLADLPFATSNNAVCEAFVGNDAFVYSFGGIDTSKTHSGIHNRSFKYAVQSNTWEEIDPLPDPQTKIAAAASFVNDKIYIIGGYHVFSNGSEVSSSKVHVYNPSTDAYEADAADIPIPIDDHVQCVYKDSLIFVVTGWSNNGNKPWVQIYDPSNDSWSAGTQTPNTSQFTAFGASGYIIGDTLYYYGGAAGGNFNSRKHLRKGYINPNDPTDIEWTYLFEVDGEANYRSACSGTDDRVFWVGGSAVSYNFNGIAYDGSGGVSPSARILHFNPFTYGFSDETDQPHGVMDLRGIAKLSNSQWIIAGGMDSNQVVTKRTWLLENESLNLMDTHAPSIKIEYLAEGVRMTLDDTSKIEVYDISGSLIKSFEATTELILSNEAFRPGIYFIQTAFGKTKIVLSGQ